MIATLSPRAAAARRQWSDPRARALLLARQLIAQEKRRVEKLVRDHLHLIRPAGAHAARVTGLPREDCEQAAFLGLVRAMETYDPTRGAAPGTHAFWWMRAATVAEYRAMRSTIRVPKQPRSPIPKCGSLDVEADDGAMLASTVLDDDAPEPGDALLSAELRDALATALDALDPRDALVLRLRFGLDGEGSRTFTAIGRHLGISGTRVRDLSDRALTQLRDTLAHLDE